MLLIPLDFNIIFFIREEWLYYICLSISLGSNSIAHLYCCLQVFLVDTKGNSFYREGKIIGFDPAYDLAVLKVYIPNPLFFSPSFYSFSEHIVLCYFCGLFSMLSTFRSTIVTYPCLLLEHWYSLTLLLP